MGKRGRTKKTRGPGPQGTVRQIRDRGTFFYIAYLGLMALMLYPPFFRGHFFDREFLPTHIFSGLIFLVWVLYKGLILKEDFLRSPVDYAGLALVGAYFLASFGAANYRSALGELLKYINYFFAYYLVADMGRRKEDVEKLLYLMVASALGVALVGIGAAAGTSSYQGALVGSRINSTLQYPNTLAAYLTGAFILATSLWATSNRPWQRGLLALVNYSFLLCFIFTLSRAAWLMFPVFYLLFVVGMPKEHRLKALGYSLQTLVAALLAAPGFGTSMGGDAPSKTWIWYFLGAGVAILLWYGAETLSRRFSLDIKARVVVASLLALVLIAGVGGYLAFSIEEPLTLAHGMEEEEGAKNRRYDIDEAQPNSEYTLKFDATIVPGAEEGQWGGAVLINSYDGEGQSVRILNHYLDEALVDEEVQIDFTTRPDTVRLAISFSNRYPGTRATFKNVDLYDDMGLPKHIVLDYKYIPREISRRLARIDTGESSFTGRMAFYRDALKIIKAHPILGTGGGGWKAVYKAYQSYQYFTTEVHSFFLQVWVEVGTVGLSALLVLWGLVGWKVLQILRSGAPSETKALAWGALLGAVALGGHSAVDFNLSLGAVALYLWQLFGIVVAIASFTLPRPLREGRKAPMWAFAISTCLFIFVSGSLYQGYSLGQEAVDYIEEEDLLGAQEAFDKASRYDPLTASFRADLAQLDYIVGSQWEDEELLEKADRERAKAIELDPYNPLFHSMMGSHHLANGDIDEAIGAYEEASRLNPYNIELWEELSGVYGLGMKVAIFSKDPHKAQGYHEKAWGILDEVTRLNEEIPESARKRLTITHDLMLDIYRTKLLAENLGDDGYVQEVDKLIFATDFTLDTDKNLVPDLWQVSNSGGGLLEIDLDGDMVRVKNTGEGRSYLTTIKDISLDPKGRYLLKAVFGGEDYRFNVYSRSGERRQYRTAKVLDKDTIKTFETTGDIEPGDQWLRFDIEPGGYVELKSLEIWEK